MSLRRLSAVPPAVGAYTPRGNMDRWITLLQPGPRNGDGSFAPFSPYASSWASIKALSGEELDKAQQIQQNCSHLVTIPFQPGITEAMQVSYMSRVFQIAYIEDPDERQFELRLYCREIGQNAGGTP